MDIIIVGAGLVGLSAAISLARQGHNIRIFERSRFSNESGAALQIAPQAVKILVSWGLDLQEMGSTVVEGWRSTSDLSVKCIAKPKIVGCIMPEPI